ncbi:MAG: hypothetical protein IPK16_02925 [Anaerolineales bacterium]|nr:hypothetical protein [Anaerolineales bacterium]
MAQDPGDAGVLAPTAVDAVVNTAFTYQGQIKKNGATFSGVCGFRFKLWNAATAGTQVGATQQLNSVQVANGIFTAQLNFGNQFTGQARWLEVGVKCPSDASFVTQSPRLLMTSSPYAIGLMPNAQISTTGTTGLRIQAGGNALVGYAKDTGYAAVYGANTGSGTGFGTYGSASANGIGAFGSGGTGVKGEGKNVGVVGQSANTAIVGNGGSYGVAGYGLVGIYGSDRGVAGGTGVAATTTSGNAIVATASGNGTGVWAESVRGNAIVGVSSQAGYAAVYGENKQKLDGWGYGVFGRVAAGFAVKGEGIASGVGVWGSSVDNVGVHGSSTNSSGGLFRTNAPATSPPAALSAQSIAAGGWPADSSVMGSLRIDHPLDPANRMLSLALVSSPEMVTTYSGNVTTDAQGIAVVTLPEYVRALSTDFRYQLTPVGQFSQAIIMKELEGSQFTIATDKPGVKVSWQLTGVRQDPYVQRYPLVVESTKQGADIGKFQNPELYGQPIEATLNYVAEPHSAQEKIVGPVIGELPALPALLIGQ